MRIIVLILTTLLTGPLLASDNVITLKLSSDLYGQLQNERELQALLARSFIEKVAALEAGYVPAAALANPYVKQHAEKTMRLLEDQPQHFVMVPRAQHHATTNISLDQESIIILPAKQTVTLPRRMTMLLKHTSGGHVGSTVALAQVKIICPAHIN